MAVRIVDDDGSYGMATLPVGVVDTTAPVVPVAGKDYTATTDGTGGWND